jgi:hypothetical protein
MRYCPKCGSEYRDHVRECADCRGTELLTAEEMHRRGKLLAREEDRRNFVRADTADNPLTAEQLLAVLEEAEIPVLSQPHGGAMDTITSPSGPWWEILVPEEFLDRAEELLREERAQMAANAEEAARAAEEEEAETEQTASKPS